MPRFVPFKESGFTLVELLVVITIIVLTTAATIPTFTGYIRNQNVKQGMELVKSDMRSIQNKAMTGTSSDALIGGTPIAFWGIKFVPNSATYQYFVSTVSNTCPAAIPAAQLQGNSTLPTNLQIKTASSFCVYFDMSNGDIVTFPNNTQVIVGYTGSSASGDCRRVMFNANGLIYSSPSVLCT